MAVTVAKLKERRADLVASVDAVMQLCEQESDRDYTPQEQKDVRQWMEEIERIDKDQLPQAEKFESLKRQRLQQQAREIVANPSAPDTAFSSQQDMTIGGMRIPRQVTDQQPASGQTPWYAVPASTHQLMAIDNYDQALALGMFLRNTVTRGQDELSRRFCEAHGIRMIADPSGGGFTMDVDQNKRYLSSPGTNSQMMSQIVSTTTAGGFLVPTLLASMILKVVDRWIIARRVARVIPMAGENLDVPKHGNTALTVDKPGEAAIGAKTVVGGTPTIAAERGNEATDIAESQNVFALVQLRAIDAFVAVTISNRLLRENVVSAADQAVEDSARAIAKQIDYEVLQADGTTGGPDWGIRGLVPGLHADGDFVGPVGTAASFGPYTTASISSLMALLQDRFYESPGDDPRCCFICSRAFYHGVFERLQIDKAFGKVDIGGRSYFTYSGYPIYFSEHMPRTPGISQVDCLFGNFYETTVVGIRQDISVAMSDAPLFFSDRTAIRVKASWGVVNHRDGNAGDGYVGLRSAAT